MKKSEKIEIRISPDDKEALARRAEAEGKPASEVVRELLQSGGVTAQAEAVPERRRRVHAVALAGAAAVGALVAVPTTLLAGAGEASWYEVEFVIEVAKPYEVGNMNGVNYEHRRAELLLPASSLGTAETLIATGPGEGYRMRLVLPDEGETLLRFPVCLQSASGCEPMAEPAISWTGAGFAQLSGVTAAGDNVFLTITPRDPEGG